MGLGECRMNTKIEDLSSPARSSFLRPPSAGRSKDINQASFSHPWADQRPSPCEGPADMHTTQTPPVRHSYRLQFSCQICVDTHVIHCFASEVPPYGQQQAGRTLAQTCQSTYQLGSCTNAALCSDNVQVKHVAQAARIWRTPVMMCTRYSAFSDAGVDSAMSCRDLRLSRNSDFLAVPHAEYTIS